MHESQTGKEMSPQHNTWMKTYDYSVRGVSPPLEQQRILVEWIAGKPGLNSLENLIYLTYHDPPIRTEYAIFFLSQFRQKNQPCSDRPVASTFFRTLLKEVLFWLCHSVTVVRKTFQLGGQHRLFSPGFSIRVSAISSDFLNANHQLPFPSNNCFVRAGLL